MHIHNACGTQLVAPGDAILTHGVDSEQVAARMSDFPSRLTDAPAALRPSP